MSEQKFDWQEVVERNPQGYMELNDGKKVVHGPVESIKINDSDMVVIILKWAAEATLSGVGLPGDWIATKENKPFTFPNLLVPFVIDDTPEKGQRVRFNGTNILYFDQVDGLDPKRVKGLNLTESKIKNSVIANGIKNAFPDEKDAALIEDFVGRGFSINGELVVASIFLYAKGNGKSVTEVLAECEKEWERSWNFQHPDIKRDPNAPGNAGIQNRVSLQNIYSALGVQSPYQANV